MHTTLRGARRAVRPTRGTAPDAFDQYLREIWRYPTLRPEEETALARRVRDGDGDALGALIRANLRFVVSVAKQYGHHGVPLEDLVSEGNLGLVRAAERFDEARGVRFLSYAVWWIRQGILQALGDGGRLVRSPVRARAQRGSATPVPWRDLSLDAPVEDEDGTMLGEMVADETTPAPDEAVDVAGSRRVLSRALACLTVRDAEIVRLHFGLDESGPLTPEEIGVRIVLEPARVRQRLAAALMHLRRSVDMRTLAAVA